MNTRKILAVFGTRPEAIKMCPLVKELETRSAFDVRVCLTGQHVDMVRSVTKHFGVNADYDLGVMRASQTLSYLTCEIIEKISGVLTYESPDVVLVHGDTTTAFAASLAAFYLGLPTAHVEAGLRTGNMLSPFPEEFNRRAVSLTAKYNFAPTVTAARNLISEGVSESRIFVTGNTVIDAVGYTVKDSFTHPLLESTQGKRVIFLTAHRRENIGKRLEEMLMAVRDIARQNGDVAVIYPTHPNPTVRKTATQILSDCEGVILCEPLDVVTCHNIMKQSYLILTDSGGLQEEAAALSVPVLVMREETERPEGIQAGVARCVGTERARIVSETERLLRSTAERQRMCAAKNPYGDGNASKRIADVLENFQ